VRDGSAGPRTDDIQTDLRARFRCCVQPSHTQNDGSCVRPPERLRMIHEAELGCRGPQTGVRKWILCGGDRGGATPRSKTAALASAANAGGSRTKDINADSTDSMGNRGHSHGRHHWVSAETRAPVPMFLAEGWTLSNVSNPQIGNLAPAGMLMLVTCQTWLRR
jgi:hypothetical protein